MNAKRILKNVAALLCFNIFGISAGHALMFYSFETLPLTEHDLPAPPIGIVIFPFLAIFICIWLTTVLAVLLFCMTKTVCVSKLIISKNERIISVVIKVIAYIIVLFITSDAIKDLLKLKQFYLSGLVFYSGMILFILTFAMIVLSLLAVEDNNSFKNRSNNYNTEIL